MANEKKRFPWKCLIPRDATEVGYAIIILIALLGVIGFCPLWN